MIYFSDALRMSLGEIARHENKVRTLELTDGCVIYKHG